VSYLCSAVAGQLLGSRKQSLQRALNSGPGSILPPDQVVARDSLSAIQYNAAFGLKNASYSQESISGNREIRLIDRITF
jgi:hypothetical protein